MGAEVLALALFLAYFLLSVYHQVSGAGSLGAFLLLLFFRNCVIKNTGLHFFGPHSPYLLNYYLYVRTYNL